MIDGVAILVLLAYGSLAVELVRFPVSSEASLYQLLLDADEKAGHDTRVARARLSSPAHKLLVYGLPTATGVVLFLIPPVAAVWRPLVDVLWPLPALDGPWSRGFGATLVVVGRVVTLTASVQLRQHKVRATLHDAGLFRWSRNPGLVGMYLFYLGLCCLFPSTILLVGLIPYVWNMHVRVLMEESHLSARFGASYGDYKARVPRYVGF